MISLLLRNVFFTILQPGIVTGLIPYLLFKESLPFKYPLQINQFIGVFIFGLGLAVMLDCIIRFAIEGRGTLSPADPTKQLVVKGLYRFSRNPMYVGVMMVLLGECLFFLSSVLCIYSLIVFAAFSVFISRFEEPRLRKDFGDQYVRYCSQVRRWI